MFKAKILEIVNRTKSKWNPPPVSEEEAIQKAKDNFMKPHIETLILSRLSHSDSYGYEIAQFVKKASGGRFRIPEGAMYPSLYRMLGRGYITDCRSESGEKPLCVHYKITSDGRVYLNALLEAYEEAQSVFTDCLTALEEMAGGGSENCAANQEMRAFE